VAAPSAGLSIGVGLGTVEDVDDDASPRAALGLDSSNDAVHPTSTTRTAPATHRDGPPVVGRRRIIATTLSGIGVNGLAKDETDAKV
jgi:hypothetical protein